MKWITFASHKVSDVTIIDLLSKIVSIIILNLVLSGDNAVVIALATRTLAATKRNKAIIIGTIGAVLLRIILMIIAMQLLAIPFVRAIGSILLFYIAYDLVKSNNSNATKNTLRSGTFLAAVRTIIIADLIMSLDNVLAIAGAADGNLLLAIFGVAISIPIVVFCSQIIVQLMHRFPFLIWIGALLIAYTAGTMLIEDKVIAHVLDTNFSGISRTQIIPLLFCMLLILGHLVRSLIITKRVK